MKPTILYTILSLIFILQACGQAQQKKQPGKPETKEYKNDVYRFSVGIPENWKLYGQIINDTIHHRSIADWGLPLTYSEIEKTEIENSISITAYHKSNINSVDQLIVAEYLRVDPMESSMEVDSTATNARIIYSTIKGLKYKGKSYFVFNNGIGYVINFMSTPGTYDKNLSLFEAFYKRIKFL